MVTIGEQIPGFFSEGDDDASKAKRVWTFLSTRVTQTGPVGHRNILTKNVKLILSKMKGRKFADVADFAKFVDNLDLTE